MTESYKALIDSSERPVSPTKLQRRLAVSGIKVSRETIFKYCKKHGIPTVSRSDNADTVRPPSLLDPYILSAAKPVHAVELAKVLQANGIHTTANGIRGACKRLGVETTRHGERSKSAMRKKRRKFLAEIAKHHNMILKLQDKIVVISRRIRNGGPSQ